MTIIDPSKVNLSEKDVEDWLWENPKAVIKCVRNAVSLKWLARQYKVPSGIIDLLGIVETAYGESHYQNAIVIELKNKPLVSADIAQVCRYAHDVEQVIKRAGVINEYIFDPDESYVVKLLIAPGPAKNIANNVMFEANALSVWLHTFSLSLFLQLNGRVDWMVEAIQKHDRMIEESANSEAFFDFRQMAYELKQQREWSESNDDPLPFTSENGDCSFTKNGDLL